MAQPSSLQTAAQPSPLSIIQTAAAYTPSLEELTKSYTENFYYTLMKFAVITIIQIVIMVWTLAGGGLADIAQNWPKYRCNPLIMPFASLFGYDASDNFNFCMKNIFSMNAGAVLAPVYGVMANFTDIVGTISNVANSFRYLIANLLHGMERLMGSFRDRFQFILFSIRMSFFKIMNLMGRLYSTFYAVIFMGMSALQAANNVANNDLVKFLLEFCFDPETPIEMASGVYKPLRELSIGDSLAAVDGVNPIVTSLFEFNGHSTPMVRIGSTIVSGKHYVFHKGWIEAAQHPDAVNVPSLERLICLNTSTHTIFIDDTLYSDYDESESPDVIKSTQELAEKTLNSGLHKAGLSNYDLGLEGSIEVLLASGVKKPIKSVQVGDILAGNSVVLGTVKEEVSSVVTLNNGLRVSSAQLIWSDRDKAWVRGASLFKSETLLKKEVFYQLITERSIIETPHYMFRDYREVTIPEMEQAYSDKLTGLR